MIDLAATWNPALIEQVAGVIREQMLAVGARDDHARAGGSGVGAAEYWRTRRRRGRAAVYAGPGGLDGATGPLLIGFARVTLEPGQARAIRFTVHPSRLAFYDPQMHFVTEPGSFWFGVGASSADIRVMQTVVLSGDIAEYRQREIVATRVVIE